MKFTKKEVDYGPSKNPAKHRCGICSFREDIPGTCEMSCEIVEGPIEKMYGCKLFDVDLIRAANDPITVASHPPTGK